MNQSEKRTRKRGKNFSPSEEMALLQLLEPYKYIIDNKKSDAYSCQLKKDAWENLAKDFIAQTGMLRTWRTLKDKYKNMNTKLKTEGRRWMDQSLVQSDESEIEAINCVSVVYKDEEEDSKDNNDDDIDINENKTIAKDPILEKVKMEPPVATTSKPVSAPVQDKLRTNYLQRSLVENRVLVRLQQRFYQNEDARASKRHHLELKSINLRNQLLEMELEERRKRIKRDQGDQDDKENVVALS